MTYPKIDEFGLGSCTCGGIMTGCSVCTCADLLLAFGKPIPRLSDGTPNMRELGRRMGARHRAAAAKVGEVNYHGLSLISTAHCANGTWCAYCIVLELRAAGLPAVYAVLSFTEILAELDKDHPMGVRGWYGHIARVAESSYDRDSPAHGRSDSFIGWHMTAWWRRNATNVIVSDSDFGSGSRPVVPPYSLWDTDQARAYWAEGRSAVALVRAVPIFHATTSGGVQVPSTTLPEEDMLRYTKATSPQLMTLAKGQRLYKFPGGPRITSMSKTAPVPHLGLGSSRAKGHAWRQVVVGTGQTYSDGRVHRTGLWVPADAGKIA